MSLATRVEPTLISALWPVERQAALIRGFVLAILGTALLTVSAKINVPFYPVPMTMQTYVVMVIAMAYGWRLGAATVALYLLQGAMGLPVFAAGGGFAYMMGPTGGYLAGFLASALVIGWLAERGADRNVLFGLVAMALGTIVIFGFGVAYLTSLIGFEKAVAGGLIPFVYGAVAKLALAAVTVPLAWRAVQKYRES